jgi:undecaprenyl-diphosphatase
VPTMFAASGYKLLKGFKNGDLNFDQEQLLLLGVGNVVAFVVSIVAIKFFIGFLQKHGFKVFGYYRIGLGLILLGLMWSGVDLKIV